MSIAENIGDVEKWYQEALEAAEKAGRADLVDWLKETKALHKPNDGDLWTLCDFSGQPPAPFDDWYAALKYMATIQVYRGLRISAITPNPEPDNGAIYFGGRPVLPPEQPVEVDVIASFAHNTNGLSAFTPAADQSADAEARETLAGRLIDAWCAAKGKQISWAKAVHIVAIVTKQSDEERDRLLKMDDEDGSCGKCGRSG